MITYGFIKNINEDETMNTVNKIIVGTFGIMIGVLMDFFILLCLPIVVFTLIVYYVVEKFEGEVNEKDNDTNKL